MSGLDFPWTLDGRGRTAATVHDEHVRDLIAQVLFTAPGERVMRPEFGAGLLQLVFEPGGPEVAASVEFIMQAALERELSHVITVERISVEAPEGALIVTVAYAVRRTGAHEVAEFRAPTGVGA